MRIFFYLCLNINVNNEVVNTKLDQLGLLKSSRLWELLMVTKLRTGEIICRLINSAISDCSKLSLRGSLTREITRSCSWLKPESSAERVATAEAQNNDHQVVHGDVDVLRRQEYRETEVPCLAVCS